MNIKIYRLSIFIVNPSNFMPQSEIVGFKCKLCGEFIEKGKCGFHRRDTGHEEFVGVYEDLIIDEKVNSQEKIYSK